MTGLNGPRLLQMLTFRWQRFQTLIDTLDFDMNAIVGLLLLSGAIWWVRLADLNTDHAHGTDLVPVVKTAGISVSSYVATCAVARSQ